LLLAVSSQQEDSYLLHKSPWQGGSHLLTKSSWKSGLPKTSWEAGNYLLFETSWTCNPRSLAEQAAPCCPKIFESMYTQSNLVILRHGYFWAWAPGCKKSYCEIMQVKIVFCCTAISRHTIAPFEVMNHYMV
jgi:hypothetical protein